MLWSYAPHFQNILRPVSNVEFNSEEFNSILNSSIGRAKLISFQTTNLIRMNLIKTIWRVMVRFSDKSMQTYITVINEIRKERKKKKKIRRAVLILLIVKLKFLIFIRSILSLILPSLCQRKPGNRSCRCLPRNDGWWDLIYHGSDDTFKKTFRVTRTTFNNILKSIRQDIEKGYYPRPQ